MDWLKLYLDDLVFGVLGAMSFVALAYAIERWFYLRGIDVTEYADPHNLGVDLTRHLTVIATVGANAPYVGLLGTVLGILITFHDLGTGGDLAARQIMLGLAMALKATAGGLLVAIPAMIAYNGLLRRVDVLQARWQGANAA
ncbi:MAG: TonB-system energizer ExbB [Gammaproteobacteria bacterium]|nr:TonB-system energizer ExbB [Gammaproteobacteria bacterium]MCP5299857.1 TonB-system energizer ExbB [Chromatiaceae bacterium]